MQRSVAIAIHDVAPATLTLCRELADLVYALDPLAPLTLLVVPDYHRRGHMERAVEFRRWIDARVTRGDELALHGFTHMDESAAPRSVRDWFARRVLTDGEGEFAALAADQARIRLQAGCHAFAQCGWQPAGFVPPAWLISSDAVRLLDEFPFAYVTSRTGITRLADRRCFESAALSASTRSVWRRWTSRQWMRIWSRRNRDAPFVRLALHPADACHDDVMQAFSDTMQELLAQRRSVTKGQWLREAL